MRPIESLLVALSGLPGVGKSTIARMLASQIGGVWLRIDSIKQAIKRSGTRGSTVDEAGYGVAYAVAEDNLRLGLSVIADSVNGLSITRDAWQDVGRRSDARVLDIEVVCSDTAEHRRRIETRADEIAGLVLPDWNAVILRDYELWSRDRLVVDTARRSATECVAAIRARIP